MAPEFFIFGYQLRWLDTMGVAPSRPGIPMHEGGSARMADNQSSLFSGLEGPHGTVRARPDATARHRSDRQYPTRAHRHRQPRRRIEVDVVEELGSDAYIYGRVVASPDNTTTDKPIITRADWPNPPERGTRTGHQCGAPGHHARDGRVSVRRADRRETGRAARRQRGTHPMRRGHRRCDLWIDPIGQHGNARPAPRTVSGRRGRFAPVTS
jgi:hypothetical protein